MKVNRNEIKTYQINGTGKVELIDELEKIEENNENLNKEVLYTNPFLFDINKSNGYYVSSIEDFYLQDKKNSYNFGQILRDGTLKKSKRNKIVKKNFKKWNKEINGRIEFVLTNANNKILETKENKIIEVPFINKFLLLISLTICILLYFHVISIINELNKSLKIVTIIVAMLSFIGLILCLIKDGINNKYRNNIDKHKQKVKKLEKQIKKDYKVNYKKAYNYYIKGMKKQIFSDIPLTMEKIVIGGDKLDYIEASTIKINDEYMKKIIKKEGLYITYKIPIFLSYALSLISGSYLIIQLIIVLVNHFMKGE